MTQALLGTQIAWGEMNRHEQQRQQVGFASTVTQLDQLSVRQQKASDAHCARFGVRGAA